MRTPPRSLPLNWPLSAIPQSLGCFAILGISKWRINYIEVFEVYTIFENRYRKVNVEKQIF